MATYPMHVAGLDRDFPICKVTDDLYIGAFIMFGDAELTVRCAEELLKLAEGIDYDYLFTAEAKSIPLIHEMARQSGAKKYFIARKGPKVYMPDPISVEDKSITTVAQQKLFLGSDDADLIRGKKILLVDDVISTGGSLKAMEALVEKAGGTVTGRMAVLAEGGAADRKDILFLEKLPVFNADGSEAQMCGNGIRCVAEWLHVHEPACAAKPVLKIDTRSGRKTLTRMGEELWQVEMGAYSTRAADLPAVNMGEGPLVRCPLTVDGKTWEVTCISVGNPHCVTLVPEVDGLKLEAIGPAFESHPNFPERINTEFVEFVDRTHLKMRVWERGSGETWACGTGTCATVAALVEQGLCPAGEDVHVALRGGELTIRVLPGRQLLMTGAASTVYEAVIEV